MARPLSFLDWYLTDAFHAEPYYSGHPETGLKVDEDGDFVSTLNTDDPEDHRNCRKGYYGMFTREGKKR